MTFRQLVAKYACGGIRTDELPSIAIKGMEAGLDSPSLVILAGLEANEDSAETQHYFKASLQELGIEIPKSRQAAIEYAIGIAEEILNGERDVVKGVSQIVWSALDAYDFYSESKHFVYDSIGFQNAYGKFVEYEDVVEADIHAHERTTDTPEMSKLKTQLLWELKNWREQMLAQAAQGMGAV